MDTQQDSPHTTSTSPRSSTYPGLKSKLTQVLKSGGVKSPKLKNKYDQPGPNEYSGRQDMCDSDEDGICLERRITVDRSDFAEYLVWEPVEVFNQDLRQFVTVSRSTPRQDYLQLASNMNQNQIANLMYSYFNRVNMKIEINLTAAQKLYPSQQLTKNKNKMLNNFAIIKNNRKINKYFGIHNVKLLSEKNGKNQVILLQMINIFYDDFWTQNFNLFCQKKFKQNDKQSINQRKNSDLYNQSKFKQLIKKTIQQYQKFISYIEQKHNRLQFLQNWYLFLDQNTLILQKTKNNKKQMVRKPIFLVYQPIILVTILKKQVLERYITKKHPQYPFIDLMLLLKRHKQNRETIQNYFKSLINKNNQKLEVGCNIAQQYQFNHLINQSIALQLQLCQQKLNPSERMHKFFLCPFFLDTNTKMLQLLQFKQIFANQNNMEYERQRNNLYNRNALKRMIYGNKQQRQERKRIYDQFNPKNGVQNSIQQIRQQKNSRKYLKANNIQKTAQLLLILGGVTEIEANIDRNIVKQYAPKFKQNFRYIQFSWGSNRLFLKPQQKNSGSEQQVQKKYHFYHFLKQIRNFYAHTKVNSKDVSLSRQQKLQIVEKQYPTINIFIYKWKYYVQQNLFENQMNIQHTSIQQKIKKILKTLFLQQSEKNPQNKKINNKRVQMLKNIQFDKYQEYKYNPKWELNIKQDQIKKITCKVCFQMLKMQKQTNIWQYLRKCRKNGFGQLFAQHTQYQNGQKRYCYWINSQNTRQLLFKNIKNAVGIFDEIQKKQYLPDYQQRKCKNSIIQQIQKNGLNIFLDQLEYKSDFISNIFLYNIMSVYPNLVNLIRMSRLQWDQSITPQPNSMNISQQQKPTLQKKQKIIQNVKQIKVNIQQKTEKKQQKTPTANQKTLLKIQEIQGKIRDQKQGIKGQLNNTNYKINHRQNQERPQHQNNNKGNSNNNNKGNNNKANQGNNNKINQGNNNDGNKRNNNDGNKGNNKANNKANNKGDNRDDHNNNKNRNNNNKNRNNQNNQKQNQKSQPKKKVKYVQKIVQKPRYREKQ